ncbi:hypothetical protein SOPP22_08935 [Shewanella sp. OPT22]|nr:hypothetical protein SOPP22_08935 [Shewanella sp. OPT22]
MATAVNSPASPNECETSFVDTSTSSSDGTQTSSKVRIKEIATSRYRLEEDEFTKLTTFAEKYTDTDEESFVNGKTFLYESHATQIDEFCRLMNSDSVCDELKALAVMHLPPHDMSSFTHTGIYDALTILKSKSTRHAQQLIEIKSDAKVRSQQLYDSEFQGLSHSLSKPTDGWTHVSTNGGLKDQACNTYTQDRMSPTYLSIRYATRLLQKIRTGKDTEQVLIDLRNAIGDENFKRLSDQTSTKQDSSLTLTALREVINHSELANMIAAHTFSIPAFSIQATNGEEVKICSDHSVNKVNKDSLVSELLFADLLKIDLFKLPPHIRSLIIEKAFENSQSTSKESVIQIMKQYELFTNKFDEKSSFKLDLKRKCKELLAKTSEKKDASFIEYLSHLDYTIALVTFPLLVKPEEKAECIKVMLLNKSHLSNFNHIIDEDTIEIIGVDFIQKHCPKEVVLATLEHLCSNSTSAKSTARIKLLLKVQLGGAPQCYSRAVFNASKHGNHEALKLLYQYPDLSHQVRTCNGFGLKRPEMIAIQNGHLQCLQAILTQTNFGLIKYPAPFCEGELFLLAAKSKDTQCLKYLLEQPGTDYRGLTKDNSEFLRLLARVGSEEAIRLTLRYPAFHDRSRTNKSNMELEIRRRTPFNQGLHFVVQRDTPYSERRTPSYASLSEYEIGNLTFVEKIRALPELLIAGDPNKLKWLLGAAEPRDLLKEIAPLVLINSVLSCKSNQVQVLKVLEKKGFKSWENQHQLIVRACINGQAELVTHLCGKYSRRQLTDRLLQLRTTRGLGLAHLAVETNNLSAMRALCDFSSQFAQSKRTSPNLKADAPLNELQSAQECIGDTPLLTAVKKKPIDIEMLELLTMRPESLLFELSSTEEDALAVAVRNNDIPAAEYLVSVYERLAENADKKVSESRVLGFLDKQSTWHVVNRHSNFTLMKKVFESTQLKHKRLASSSTSTKLSKTDEKWKTAQPLDTESGRTSVLTEMVERKPSEPPKQ